MNSGQKMMFNPLAITSTRNAIAASPAPRKMPLSRNRKTITTLVPIMMRMNGTPISTTCGSAPSK